MGNYTHTNFFTSTLAGGASGVGTNLQLADTSLYVATGDGSKAGTPSSTSPGYVMLGSYSGTHELCSYTGVSGDHLTGLTRGLEGTTAQVWALTTSVQGVETAGMQGHILYDDGSKISTDGSGGITVAKYPTVNVDTTGGNVNVIHFGPDAHSSADWYGVVNSSGDFVLWDNHNSRTALRVLLSSGALGTIAGQPTAGSYGVPLVSAIANRTTVSVNTDTVVTSFTTPNDGANHVVRLTSYVYVGIGNTNNGTISVYSAYTDPDVGALTVSLTNYASAAVISALAVTKGATLRTIPQTIVCTPNSTVAVHYQNNVAGTISDHVTATIELLA